MPHRDGDSVSVSVCASYLSFHVPLTACVYDSADADTWEIYLSIYPKNIIAKFRKTHTHTHTHIYIYIYIYIYIVSWPTVVEGDPKATLSIAATLRCRGGRYSFSWIAPLILDPYRIMLGVEQGSIKYHFLSFAMTRPRIEPRFPNHWRTL